jgi:hypothetical protein
MVGVIVSMGGGSPGMQSGIIAVQFQPCQRAVI